MYKTILIPIDISEQDLTNLVIPHTERMAKLGDPMFHFVAVIPSYTTYSIAYATRLPDPEEMKNATLEKLEEITKAFRIPNTRIQHHIDVGSARDKILNLSEAIEADLIIVGSRRPSISTHLLGSTSSAIVRYAKTSVLVVR